MGLRGGIVRGNRCGTSTCGFKISAVFERRRAEVGQPLHNASKKDFHFQTGFKLRSRCGLYEGRFQSAAVAVRIQFRIEQGFVCGLGLVVILGGVFLFRSDHICGIVAVFRNNCTGAVIERSYTARGSEQAHGLRIRKTAVVRPAQNTGFGHVRRKDYAGFALCAARWIPRIDERALCAIPHVPVFICADITGSARSRHQRGRSGADQRNFGIGERFSKGADRNTANLAANRCEDKVGNRRRSGNRLGIYVFYCHTITPYNSVTSACGMIAAFFRSSVMALISRMTRFVKERSAVTMPM